MVYEKISSRHEEVRRKCVEHIKDHQDRFKSFLPDVDLNEYLETMSRDGTYGDEPEIRAMEELFDRRICIYQLMASSNSLLLPDASVEDQDGVEPFRISYHNGNHYNAVEYSLHRCLPLHREVQTTNILDFRVDKFNEDLVEEAEIERNREMIM